MGLTSVGQNCHFNGVLNLLGIKGTYLQMNNFSLWWHEQDLYLVISTHHNAYSNLLFKVNHWCTRTVCSKFSHAVQGYPKCWGNFGQQYFSFSFVLNLMSYNLNKKNIIIHNKTRDMLPSISSTILHVRYSEHGNSKSVQSAPIWRYWTMSLITRINDRGGTQFLSSEHNVIQDVQRTTASSAGQDQKTRTSAWRDHLI